jgi:hypothetical protein
VWSKWRRTQRFAVCNKNSSTVSKNKCKDEEKKRRASRCNVDIFSVGNGDVNPQTKQVKRQLNYIGVNEDATVNHYRKSLAYKTGS